MCNVLCYDRVADVYKDGDCYIVVLHVIILLRMFHFEIIYIYICMYVFIFKSIIFFSKLLLVDESAKGIIMIICMYIRATVQ